MADAVDTNAVAFGDVQRMLALFAQALAGRSLHLQVAIDHAATGPRRVAAGESAVVLLPARIADHPSAPQNLGAYRIAVLHQVGYLEAGTVDFDLAVAAHRMALPARPSPPSAPWAGLGVPTVAPLQRFFDTWPRPALLRKVFVTLEDGRIDSQLRRAYPGARVDLDRVLAHALAQRPPLAALRPLAALIEALVQASLGAPRPADGPGPLGALRGRLLDAAAGLRAPTSDVYDSARIAIDICGWLEAWMRHPPRAMARRSDAAIDAPATAADGLPSEASGAGPGELRDGLAEPGEEDLGGPAVAFRGSFLPDRLVRSGRGGQGGAVDAEGAASSAAYSATDQGGDRPSAPRPARPATKLERGGPRTVLVDEWDCHGRRYLKAWCRVHELPLRGDGGPAFIAAVRRRHGPLAAEVRRSFAAVRPESWRRVHHAADGDELELQAVIDALVDRRSGHHGDDGLWLRRDRARRDVAAAFLLDMSASTDFPVPDPAQAPAPAPVAVDEFDEDDHPFYAAPHRPPASAAAAGPGHGPSKRRVIDVAKEALALMCEALHTLGDRHAVYGFSGEGRERVEFHIAKTFDEPVSARTWSALAAMQPRGSTRMGAAIRHALAQLRRQTERRKLLLIVSDGYPQDQGYGPDRMDEDYGLQDTARALQEAAAAGVGTFCLTIDPAGHDYLRRMCAPERYLVIDEVDALPAALSRVYRSLTG